MKNRILRIVALVIGISGLGSCADLDLPSDGRMTLKDMFSDYFRTRNYFNAVKGFMPQVGFTYGQTPLASFSDEAHDASDGVSSNVNNWYNNRTSPASNPVAGDYSWGHYFQAIRKANTFLTSINDPNIAVAVIDEDEKNGWIGEVLVMRAFYYLQLVKRFGGVPLISTPYEVTHDFSQDRRATFEECVDFILADCDAALAIPESGKSTVGFRWDISDNERGTITRAFAHAVRSQAALYAASPLFYTAGSKYTWEKATEITKEALDACLGHGFELFDITPPADVAQNAYAYYFINRSDPSRSVDKETIYETTALRANVWKWAGTPITQGAEKAGAGPSQELVDAYGMQATGQMPVLGYSDAQHLQPMINTASGYNPANPYEGRDPRFYASIYYNNSPRSLSTGNIEKALIPLGFTETVNNVTTASADDAITLSTTGGDPWIHTTTLNAAFPGAAKHMVTFEYKSNKTVSDAEFFYCVAGGPQGGVSSGQNIVIEEAAEWKRFEYDLSSAIADFGFGVNADGGQEPANHFLRFDLTGGPDYELTIRNFNIESFTPPSAATPVQTFVGGNSGISSDVTQTRFTRTGYYLRKFNNYKSGINTDQDGLMKIFRLGELYLNFAEAAYQSVGPDAQVESKASGAGALSAREAVNIIRARADMPALPPGLNAEEFEVRYRNERRVELAFEEHRFFDVRRWKILNETDKFVTGMRIVKDGDDYEYNRIKLQDRNTHTDKYLLQPINQSEVSKMASYTGEDWQNPGW
ncbi:RagB/SusD family nutrient uptake outer membrane protein [Parapedobacter sp. 10938]|uniref:RagB/SusD family nutrient uptake outer membrane protein n=1 Tax=Parapedobacter flavus TaxID=3110225 RepID=UPI002DB96F42|nr:RagB/SusD family nutrient uptake outer membrane protein [Parapedobacter sp. 10938]MEC3878804.1 RagB/SusD family nutrient uptake outer membrane protein [Parapedobacter sp. 10938]